MPPPVPLGAGTGKETPFRRVRVDAWTPTLGCEAGQALGPQSWGSRVQELGKGPMAEAIWKGPADQAHHSGLIWPPEGTATRDLHDVRGQGKQPDREWWGWGRALALQLPELWTQNSSNHTVQHRGQEGGSQAGGGCCCHRKLEAVACSWELEASTLSRAG